MLEKGTQISDSQNKTLLPTVPMWVDCGKVVYCLGKKDDLGPVCAYSGVRGEMELLISPPTLGSLSPFIRPVTLLSNFLLKNLPRTYLAELSKMRGGRGERQEENGLPLIMSVQSWGLQLRIKSHLGIIQLGWRGENTQTHRHVHTQAHTT